MSGPAKLPVGAERLSPVVLTEWDPLDFEIGQESIQDRLGIDVDRIFLYLHCPGKREQEE